jgi:GH25 family lysozyme M1 (1,4-beta-N-acetylmuramidase)
MTSLPFGLDFSRHQGLVNWNIIAVHEPKVRFAGIRATISWGYIDEQYARNFAECQRIGRVPLPYHVLYPKESVAYQIDNFLNTVRPATGQRVVLDCELAHELGAPAIRKSLRACIDYITLETAMPPIIYSRANWIDQYITGINYLTGYNPPAPTWLNEYDWWLAQYLSSGVEHSGPPTLPKGVSRQRCIFHQTTDRGVPYGVQSDGLDYDRWQGDDLSFNKYFGLTAAPVEPTDHEILEIMWKNHPELHDLL